MLHSRTSEKSAAYMADGYARATVDSVERFPDMLRQAFRVATSGAPGPVHLQFRGNEAQLD